MFSVILCWILLAYGLKFCNYHNIFRRKFKAVEIIHGATGWELDTILQEAGNCRLYEKTGYERTDKIQRVNDKMTLGFYKK